MDAEGRRIFPSTPFEEVVGPKRGVGPIAGWTNRGFDQGSYIIRLTGTVFCNQSGSATGAVKEQ